MLQQTTTKSIIVHYPAIPATSTIRNTPDAILAYLENVAPKVAGIVKEIAARKPALRERAIRAGLIVVQQKVTLRPENANLLAAWNFWGRGTTGTIHAKIKSSTSENEYEIVSTTSDWNYLLNCTCPDHAPATRRTFKACKHVIAYLITKTLELERKGE